MKTKLTWALLVLGCAVPAWSNDDDVARPQAYNNLVSCRSIVDDNDRLACFDKMASALEQSVEQKNLVLLDRAEVKKTKRSLFGFSLPDLPFFDNDDDDEEQLMSRIETTFDVVEPIGYGKWQFVLPEAGTWQTTEPVKFSLKAGQKVLIKRGAGGGYLMQVGNGGYIRVKRVA